MGSRRVERTSIRWLMRATVAILVTIAGWSTYLNRQERKRFATASEHRRVTRPKAVGDDGKPFEFLKANTVVVASQQTDDTSWFDGIMNGWDKLIYVTDGESLDNKAKLPIPQNKGREGMVYLSYIIDNYYNLPNITLFVHSVRYQWHNDDPLYDGVSMLEKIRPNYIADEGYVNLRCCWTLGCPSQVKPLQTSDTPTDAHYAEAWKELFPGVDVPHVVGVGCCAQFGVSRSQIRSRPVQDYIRFRRWLLQTELEDAVSGRILEYSWHVIFGKEAIHCPLAQKCYCGLYGLCDLSCPESGICEGRYTLPPYSTMPDGWPAKGWDGGPGPLAKPGVSSKG